MFCTLIFIIVQFFYSYFIYLSPLSSTFQPLAPDEKVRDGLTKGNYISHPLAQWLCSGNWGKMTPARFTHCREGQYRQGQFCDWKISVKTSGTAGKDPFPQKKKSQSLLQKMRVLSRQKKRNIVSPTPNPYWYWRCFVLRFHCTLFEIWFPG